MARIRIHGFAHAGILAVVAVVAISGLLLWVYYNKSAQLAQTNTGSTSSVQPITTTAQAVSGVQQVQASLNSLNVNAQLDTSTIDSVLNNQ